MINAFSGVFLSVRTHVCNLYKKSFFFLSPEPNVSKREDNDPDCSDKIVTIKFKKLANTVGAALPVVRHREEAEKCL